MIDADAREWTGLPVHTKKNLSFAVCNDSSYLYILLTTTDHSLERQLSGPGMNLWFDASGGSEKTFGIHYPFRMPGSQQYMTGNEAGMEDPPRMMEGGSNEMEILGPGKEDRMIVALAESKDIQLKMSSASGQLVFELRVPIVRDALHPHGIGANIAHNLGLGLETPKFSPERVRETTEGGMPTPGGQDGGNPQGGEMGGGRGGHGGHHGAGGGGQRGITPEAVSLWGTVILAGK